MISKPTIGGLAYQALVKRVETLKGKFNANAGRLPEVVYMSDDYWNVVKDKVLYFGRKGVVSIMISL